MPQQQLLEIARALGANAKVLIMDEPTASLNTAEVEQLLRIVQQLREQGLGIVYIRIDSKRSVALHSGSRFFETDVGSRPGSQRVLEG